MRDLYSGWVIEKVLDNDGTVKNSKSDPKVNRCVLCSRLFIYFSLFRFESLSSPKLELGIKNCFTSAHQVLYTFFFFFLLSYNKTVFDICVVNLKLTPSGGWLSSKDCRRRGKGWCSSLQRIHNLHISSSKSFGYCWTCTKCDADKQIFFFHLCSLIIHPQFMQTQANVLKLIVAVHICVQSVRSFLFTIQS